MIEVKADRENITIHTDFDEELWRWEPCEGALCLVAKEISDIYFAGIKEFHRILECRIPDSLKDSADLFSKMLLKLVFSMVEEACSKEHYYEFLKMVENNKGIDGVGEE